MLFATCLLAVIPQADYDGKFRAHPNIATVIETVEATAKKAPKSLPKWLAKRTPVIEVTLVDATEPFATMAWPGKVSCTSSFEKVDKTWVGTIELPVDSLIRDPKLAEYALKRQIFGIAATVAELDAGVDIMRMGQLGLENPFIDAMASNWAGSLDTEIDYILRAHLDSDEELAALVSDLEEPAGGGFKLEERGADDLTVLVLAKMLAPKKDKKLGDLFTAITRTQPFEAALKSATRKNLDKLNPELRKFYGKFLEKRFLKKDRGTYRRISKAFAERDWPALVEASNERDDPALTAFNADYFRAFMTSAQALEEPIEQEGAGLSLLMLKLSRNRPGQTRLAVDAQERIGEVYRKLGDKERAREAWETLRDDFGWQPGVRERAEELLKTLDA